MAIGYAVTLFREPTSRLASQLYHMFSLYGRSIAFGIDDADVIPIIGILKGRKLTKELADSFPQPIVDETSPTGYKHGVSNFAPQMEKFKQVKLYIYMYIYIYIYIYLFSVILDIILRLSFLSFFPLLFT